MTDPLSSYWSRNGGLCAYWAENPPKVIGIATRDGRIILSHFLDYEHGDQMHEEMMLDADLHDTECARLHESFVRFWICVDPIGGEPVFVPRVEAWPSWWSEDRIWQRLEEIGEMTDTVAAIRRLAIQHPNHASDLVSEARIRTLRAAFSALLARAADPLQKIQHLRSRAQRIAAYSWGTPAERQSMVRAVRALETEADRIALEQGAQEDG